MTQQPNDNSISESAPAIDVDATPVQATPTLVSEEPPRRLLDLPIEILMELALCLECRDFSQFIQTCRSIHDSLDTHYIWHRRFLIRFGQPFLTSKLREHKLVPESSPSSPISPSSPASPVFSTSSSGYFGSPSHSPSTSTASSPRLEDGYLSSNPSEGESSDHHEDDQVNADKTDLKGKGRQFDIRKTNEASKEFLISLYRQWCKSICVLFFCCFF